MNICTEQVYKDRLDEWLKYPEPVIKRMLQNAKNQMEEVRASQMFDEIIVNDDIRDALDEVKAAISKFRPDIIPPLEEDYMSAKVE